MRPFIRFQRPSYIHTTVVQPSPPAYEQNEIFGYRPEPPQGIQTTKGDQITTATSVPIQVLNSRVTTQQVPTAALPSSFLRLGEEAGVWTTARITIENKTDASFKQDEVEVLENKEKEMDLITTTNEQETEATTHDPAENEIEKETLPNLEALFDRTLEETTTEEATEPTTDEITSTTEESSSPISSSSNFGLVEFLVNDMWNAALDFQKFIDSIAEQSFALNFNVQMQSLQNLLENLRDKKQEVTVGDADKISNQVISITTHISVQRLRSSVYVEKKQRLENLAKLLKFTVAAATAE